MSLVRSANAIRRLVDTEAYEQALSEALASVALYSEYLASLPLPRAPTAASYVAAQPASELR